MHAWSAKSAAYPLCSHIACDFKTCTAHMCVCAHVLTDSDEPSSPVGEAPSMLTLQEHSQPLQNLLALDSMPLPQTHSHVCMLLCRSADATAVAAAASMQPEPQGSHSHSKPLTPAQLAPCAITQQDFETAVKKVQPSVRREGFATTPDVTWSDVGSLAEVTALCTHNKALARYVCRPYVCCMTDSVF